MVNTLSRSKLSALDQLLEPVISVSQSMQYVISEIHKVAPTSSNIHLRGETGVGKEVLARLAHNLSSRKDAPFVAVNCAAQTETLLESELFGHERGAFSGAIGKHIGLIERAEGGTLFLDEIGDITARFQMLLLRVLQEREFVRVGGSIRHKANIRLITATNKNLEAAVPLGQFRLDLYFRICVFTLIIPPLRERPEDIRPLAEMVLRRAGYGPFESCISNDAIDLLQNCQWPGNVRELINCIERAMISAQGGVIKTCHIACTKDRCLSKEFWNCQETAGVSGSTSGADGDCGKFGASVQGCLHSPSSTDERTRLIDALRAANGIQARAARLLGLTPRQVGYAMHKHGIMRGKF